MNIYVESAEKIISEVDPDMVVDCRLRSHREILRVIADYLAVDVPPRATIYDMVQSIALSRPPYRRIMLLHADRAPARLALSLDIIARAGRHVVYVHAHHADGGAVPALRAAGHRVVRSGVAWADVRGALVYTALLGVISLTVVMPYQLRAWGVDGGIALVMVIYIARRYLWRALFRIGRR